MKATVAIAMACDTKGEEARFLKEKIIEFGADALLIDVGIRGTAKGVVPDITRWQLAEQYGRTTMETVCSMKSRGEAMDMVNASLTACLNRLYREGKINGVCALGGAGSMSMTASAMQSLPYGVPKMLASTLASGHRQFEPFVGSADMIVMYPITDVCGLNWISKMMFENIAAAMVGMCNMAKAVQHGREEKKKERCIGVTMYGQTTPGAMAAKAVLEAAGYTCLMFHANGVGGPCMEKLIKAGDLVAVLDYTLAEMVGTHIRGYTKCSPERMTVAGSCGLPLVAAPGAMDFINILAEELQLPENRERVYYNHNAQFPLLRTTAQEMEKLAHIAARILNAAKGPTAFVLPSMGFSMANRPGEKLWDEQADNAFRTVIRRELDRNRVKLIEYSGNLNDEACGQLAAQTLLCLLES